MQEIKQIEISKIRIDGETQPREHIDYEAVDDYRDSLIGGDKFPPIVLFFDGSDYWLADGFHRYHAIEQTEATTISAKVHKGSVIDARWYSYSANITNGLRRTNADKQRSVSLALGHPKSKELTSRQIARHCGVDHQTVENWKMKASGEFRQSRKRNIVSDYQHKVHNFQKEADEKADKKALPIDSQLENFTCGESTQIAGSAKNIMDIVFCFIPYLGINSSKLSEEIKAQFNLNRIEQFKEVYVFLGKVIDQL
jgi:hypothetical protein